MLWVNTTIHVSALESKDSQARQDGMLDLIVLQRSPED